MEWKTVFTWTIGIGLYHSFIKTANQVIFARKSNYPTVKRDGEWEEENEKEEEKKKRLKFVIHMYSVWGVLLLRRGLLLYYYVDKMDIAKN